MQTGWGAALVTSKPHKRLLQRVRAGITWAQDPQWEGYEDAEQAYRELNELLDDAIDREKALEEQLETFLDAAWKFEHEMANGEFVHFGEFRRALVAASGEDRGSNPVKRQEDA